MGRPATTIEQATAEGWFRPNERDGECHCGCGEMAPVAEKTRPSEGHLFGKHKRFIHGHRVRLGSPSESQVVRAKIGEAQRGERSWRWKGDAVGYSAIHKWLAANFEKTGICEHCRRARPTDWANISGDYRRRRDDFLELCRSCHRRFDEKKRAA